VGPARVGIFLRADGAVREDEAPDAGEGEAGEECPEKPAAPDEARDGEEQEQCADGADGGGAVHDAIGLGGGECRDEEEGGQGPTIDSGRHVVSLC